MSQTNFVIFIMYDIPVEGNRKAYQKIFTKLKKLGFYQLQHSIYIKPISEKHKAERYLAQVKELSPSNCHIRALILSYATFLNMNSVVGVDSFGESLVKKNKSVIML